MPTLILNVEVPTEVSDEDFDYLNGFSFRLGDRGYLVCSSAKHHTKKMHQIIAERMNLVNEPDHKDTNKLNNRRDNLREATRSQNMCNIGKYPSNKSGYKFVHWSNQKQKWIARVTVNKQRHHVGEFHDPKQAFEAACAFGRRHLGEFFNSGENDA